MTTAVAVYLWPYLTGLPSSGDDVPDLTAATAGADDRFGVILSDSTYYEKTLSLLGIRWYLDYSYDSNRIPIGTTKVLKVRTNRAPVREALQASARALPGSFWLIGNEPNAPGQDDIPPEEYASVFYQYVSLIKQADPSARIVGPEVLNFDTTCTGCPGFPSGRAWTDQFRRSYRQSYGTEPPIDIWSIHTYDLDWEHLPQGNYQAQAAELLAFRAYLDSEPTSRGAPIWLTEFSVVWGYEGIRWSQQNGSLIASPEGVLRKDRLAAYLDQMVAWLRAHSTELRLQRWFLFSSHAYQEPWATAAGGIALVQEKSGGLQTTPLGARYRALAHDSATR